MLWLIGALLLAALGVRIGAPHYFYRLVFTRKAPLPGTPAFMREEARRRGGEKREWIDEQAAERAVIVSHDGLTLEGIFVPAPALPGLSGTRRRGAVISADTVILAHGYTGDARQLGGIAQSFYEQYGWNVLLPHARGHGASQGAYIGFGWHDRLDYLRWIDWALRRTAPPGGAGAQAGEGDAAPQPVRIVLFGISMGAATVLMTGGEEALPPEVKAIIEDCGYTSAEDELRYQAARRFHIKRADWLVRAVSRQTQKYAGFALEEVSTLNQVKKIRVPTLFIHGDADTFVPYTMVHGLYEACSAPKELYTVKGAEHGLACEMDKIEYERRITVFLQNYMPGGVP